MPIISPIGRKSPATRVLIGTIYLLLMAGAVTMVYPFLLMIAGTSKSAVDALESPVIPPFLVSEKALYQKSVEGLFNEKLDLLRFAYGINASSFRKVEPPAQIHAELVREWNAFLAAEPPPAYAYSLGFVSVVNSRGTQPKWLRELKRRLSDQFGGDIHRLNRELGTQFAGWNSLYVFPENFLIRRGHPSRDGFTGWFQEFKKTQAPENRCYFSVDHFFKFGFLQSRYSDDLAAYNQTHGTGYESWDDIHLDRRLPAGRDRTPREIADWELFVRTILNPLWIRADAEAAPEYRAFLHARYPDIETMNRQHGVSFASFEEIPIPSHPPAGGAAAIDWDSFWQGWTDPKTGALHQIPARRIRVASLDFAFRDFLRAEFSTLELANAALGTTADDWLDFTPPQAEVHLLWFQENKNSLRREFLCRNFISVLDYVLFHGRALFNTAWYCLLAVLTALLVNPLAAYALSRFRPPSTYKVLLFLMLTMSFPPIVTQIPVFLMLRRLDLLNTFWALLLPGLASGYSIFLLKGFFDSLPRELYECAELDGASEFRIFWQITMSLSQPILAVVGLNAFIHAYVNFMYALLICQDERMWTIMPWLYQLQMRSGPGVVFASLLLASIPTFFVFVFCQKIILRGIVLPVEK